MGSLRRIRLVLAPLCNHEIAFGCESVAATPPSSHRPPCFPAFPAVARGALSLRFARSARHLAVTSLRSCARLRLRGYPPLRFGAFTLSCPSALRRTIRSPIRAVRLRAEYRPSPPATVPTAPDASRHPCALGSPVALHLARSRYSSCHSRYVLAALPRLRAALCAANVQREPK